MLKRTGGDMKKVIQVFALLMMVLILSLVVYIYNPLAYPANETIPHQMIINQGRQVIGDQVIIHLKGSPFEVGYQHGSLLKTEIQGMLDIMYDYIENVTRVQNLLLEGYLNYVSRTYYQYIPERYRQEMQGVAQGAGVKLQDIILINTFDELYNLSQCTNVAVWGDYTEDGQVIHGRNLDYMLSDKLWNRQIVFVYDVNGAEQVVSVGWPGYVGVLTGMNEAGLSLGSMTSEIKDNSIFGTPSGILYRSILESAKNLNEVEAMLKASKRTIGNNLMVASAADHRANVFELTPDWVTSRADYTRNVVAATNHFEILREVNTFPDLTESVYRQRRATELVSLYAIDSVDVKDMISILNDRLIDGEDTRPIGNNINVQSVVFVPEEMEIWISINDVVPAAVGSFTGYKFVPESAEPLQLLRQREVSDEYLNSQYWFHRKDQDYWTDERVQEVIANYELREMERNHYLLNKAKFLLNVERFEKAIQIYEELIPALGDGQWIHTGDSVYYERGYYLLLNLAQAYSGLENWTKAKELVEELLTYEIYDDWIKQLAEEELFNAKYHLGLR